MFSASNIAARKFLAVPHSRWANEVQNVFLLVQQAALDVIVNIRSRKFSGLDEIICHIADLT